MSRWIVKSCTALLALGPMGWILSILPQPGPRQLGTQYLTRSDVKHRAAIGWRQAPIGAGTRERDYSLRRFVSGMTQELRAMHRQIDVPLAYQGRSRSRGYLRAA